VGRTGSGREDFSKRDAVEAREERGREERGGATTWRDAGVSPARDGFVAGMGVYDELGGGIDAVHVRCEMATPPPTTR